MEDKEDITELVDLVIKDDSKIGNVSKSESESGDDTGEHEREQWANKLDSILSLIGYCVGFGNIWRFPYFCMRNGGGPFLVAFLCILVVCGIPTYFLDLVMGQFSGKTSLHAWQICPLLQGIGAAAVLVLFVINTYYNLIIAWTLFYLGSSFFIPLPWTTCDNSWNTADCISNRTVQQGSQFTNWSSVTSYNSTNQSNDNVLAETVIKRNLTFPEKMVTSEEEFWQYQLLEISSGIEEIGGLKWKLSVCLLASWLLTYIILIRGIRSSGKVVYVTALLPYVILTALLIRAVLLPGAGEGILYFLTPNLHKLLEPQVWLEASLQVFYSLGPGWGPLVTLSSFNKFHNNCYRDAILMVFISEGTSIYGGFVVFAVLGYMAHETGMHIYDVVTSGPGLVFMTYPEALAHLPLPNVWTVLFFLMLVTVGIDSQLSCVETVISAVLDQFPTLRQRRVLVQAVGCTMWYFLGLILCTQGGMYVFIVLDWYMGLSVPILAFLECVIIGWIYGTERFSRDVELMLGRGIPVLMRIGLTFIAPSILLTIAIATVTTYKPPTYGNYRFPPVVSTLGLLLGLSGLVPVIFGAVKALRNAHGRTFIKRLINASKPSSHWKPASPKYAQDYTYDELGNYRDFRSRIKVNVFGSGNTTKWI